MRDLSTRLVIFFLLGCMHLPKAIYGQATQAKFGKNRVQYHSKQEEWMYYETEHFTTYWYGDARNIAEAALQIAEEEYQDVRRVVDYAMADKIELIVFTDLTDLKQSNIGIDEVFLIAEGETKVIGNKAFVYFDGNHRNLKRQVREATAGVVLNAVLFGRNFQEIIQNAVLLNLPEWFPMGVVAYCGQDWSVERDNQLKDILLTGRYKDFKKLARDYPRLAGHAFWYYFSLHYGPNQINSVINILASERDADNSFRYVTGQGEKALLQGLMTYFMQRYKADMAVQTAPDVQEIIPYKNKKCRQLSAQDLSPDGRQLAYVLNDMGKWSLFIQAVDSKTRKRIMHGGTRNKLQDPDMHYPLVAWAADQKTLGIVHEYRDQIKLTIYDTESGKKQTENFTPEYQRIYSLDFIHPGQVLVSASVQGYSDLFLYNIVTRSSERITQDHWDDLDAKLAYLNNGRMILFSSNRLSDTLQIQKLDTILPVGHFDIFAYDLETRSKELIRLSNSPLADERGPVGLDSMHFACVTNQNGQNNREAGYLVPYTAFTLREIYLRDGSRHEGLDLSQKGEWDAARCLAFYPPFDTVKAMLDSTMIDSIVTKPVIKYRSFNYQQTNLDRNILAYVTAPRAGKAVELIRRNCSLQIYRSRINPDIALVQVPYTRFRQLTYPEQTLGNMPQNPEDTNLKRTEKKDSVATIPEGWLFQIPERFQKSNTIEPITATPASDLTEVHFTNEEQKDAPIAKVPQRFNPSRIIPYRLKFRTDFVTTDVDNGLLFEGLESFAGSPQGFLPPPPGLLIKGNFKELMEDYVLELGMRVPVLFNGAEYYMTLDSRKKRIDRRYALYRRTVVNTIGQTSGFNSVPIRLRSNIFLGQYELRYPFDAFMSLRGTATLRQDRAITQALNDITIATPVRNEQRAALKLAFVYDDHAQLDENLRYGTRGKISAEVVQRFALNAQPELSFEINKGVMGILTLDARHYRRLDRHSILAFKAAAATSFGAEQILYYLGGVENWMFPSFQTSIPVAQDRNFAFEAQATNLRGFRQNIRNGNSYALINSELRVPFAKYLSKKPTLRSFWRNLQLVGFFDAGTAWTGLSPYSGDNPLNTQTFYNPPAVSVTVNYFRDPLVMGYGGGLRMKVLGTFLRVDYAKGIETRRIQPGIWYIGIGSDF